MSTAIANRYENLARANVVLIGMAHVKREVRAGQLAVSKALFDERAQSLSIGALLAAQHYWGEARTTRYLGTHFINPRRRVRDLTERQKAAIAAELDQQTTTRRTA